MNFNMINGIFLLVAANIQTAGILIGAFGGVVVLILVIMLSVFIYRKQQTKQGMYQGIQIKDLY